jgi:hypothetical protein
MRTWIIRLVIVLIIATLGTLVWPYLESKSGQVQRRQARLMKLASKRNWEAVTPMLAKDYEDQWGLDRTDSVSFFKEMLQGFIVLDIQWTTEAITVTENTAKVRGHAKVTGSGLGLSQNVIDVTNNLKEPWVFTWRTNGWKPTDWELLSVSNSELGSPLQEDDPRPSRP